MDKIKAPVATERRWYICPHCGQKLLIYTNTAQSRGIYLICKRCGDEIEIKI